MTFRAASLALVLSACGAAATPAPAHQRAADFSALDQHEATITLSSLRGQAVVLYFYPRDATPGCTEEACAFRDAWDRLETAGARVLGVSTDGVESHRAFAEEHMLPFSLLSDEDGSIAASYGVAVTMGYAARTTFIIDGDGVIRRVFENVDPGVHVDEVLATLAEL